MKIINYFFLVSIGLLLLLSSCTMGLPVKSDVNSLSLEDQLEIVKTDYTREYIELDRKYVALYKEDPEQSIEYLKKENNQLVVRYNNILKNKYDYHSSINYLCNKEYFNSLSEKRYTVIEYNQRTVEREIDIEWDENLDAFLHYRLYIEVGVFKYSSNARAYAKVFARKSYYNTTLMRWIYFNWDLKTLNFKYCDDTIPESPINTTYYNTNFETLHGNSLPWYENITFEIYRTKGRITYIDPFWDNPDIIKYANWSVIDEPLPGSTTTTTITSSNIYISYKTLNRTIVYTAPVNIYVGPNVNIISPANVTLNAGGKIFLRNGTIITSGSKFRAAIY